MPVLPPRIPSNTDILRFKLYTAMEDAIKPGPVDTPNLVVPDRYNQTRRLDESVRARDRSHGSGRGR